MAPLYLVDSTQEAKDLMLHGAGVGAGFVGGGEGGVACPLAWLAEVSFALLRWRRDVEAALLEVKTASSDCSSSPPFPSHGSRAAARSSVQAGAARLRHIFTAATAELLPLGRTPPLLWRLYARFEAASGRWGAARRVILRGLSACPGCKALLIDATAALDFQKNARASELARGGVRCAFPGSELSQLLADAEEKGICYRVDLVKNA